MVLPQPLPLHISENVEHDKQTLPHTPEAEPSTSTSSVIEDTFPAEDSVDDNSTNYNVINLNLGEIEDKICAKISTEISTLKKHIDNQFSHLYSHLSAKIDKIMENRVSSAAAVITANNFEVKPVSNQQEAHELEKKLENANYRLEMVRIIIIFKCFYKYKIL